MNIEVSNWSYSQPQAVTLKWSWTKLARFESLGILGKLSEPTHGHSSEKLFDDRRGSVCARQRHHYHHL